MSKLSSLLSNSNSRLTGVLWLIAGLLFILSALGDDGNNSNTAIGIMFLTLGIVFLKQHSSKDDENPQAGDDE